MKTWHLKCKHYDNYRGGGCSIYANGTVVRGCNASGCGYDREGAALANFVNEHLQEELQLAFSKEFESLENRPFIHYGDNHWGRSVKPSDMYGVTVQENLYEYKKKPSVTSRQVHIDGACGKSVVERVCSFIGYDLQYLSGTNTTTDYLLKGKL